jgi:pimeloyl-ACP methyl ester carboxylesterase
MSRLAAACFALAAALACTASPPAPQPTPTQEGLANGSFVAELGGFSIHYEVHGRGPALMTLPNSWGLSLQGLRAMYRPLEEKLTLVYFDPRGMGGSGPVREEADRGMPAVRADFHALREHLGLDAVHAIGWSNGAANLIFLAHERPETLRSAIFLHSGASYTQQDAKRLQRDFPELFQAFGTFMQDVAANPDLSEVEKTSRMRALWLETYFPKASADPEAAKARLAETFAEAEFSWPHAEYTQRTLPGFDARDKLAAIPVRSLVIAGAHDLLPPELVRPLADGLPNAEFVVFDASGHFAPIEEPEAFEQTVFAFLGVGG